MPDEALSGMNDQSRRAMVRTTVADIDTSCLPDVSFSDPAIITPTAVTKSAVTVATPFTRNDSSLSVDTLRLVVEETRIDAEQSAQTIASLSDGIRAVKRILEATTRREEVSHKKGITEDLRQVFQLSESLQGVLGSDLLALVNAADMIREHSTLAFQETGEVVTDLRRAQLEAEVATADAKHKANTVRSLLKTNADLQREVETLRQQKRILVKEVKTMRQNEMDRRFLEERVLTSLTVHECVLRTPSSILSRKNFIVNDDQRDDENVDPRKSNKIGKEISPERTPAEERLRSKGAGRGFRIFQRNKGIHEESRSSVDPLVDNSDTGKENDMGLLRGFGTPTRHHRKSTSLDLRLEELSMLTEDSSSMAAFDEEIGKSDSLGQEWERNPPTLHRSTLQSSQRTS